ncbi:hypothetical protein T439DRAFT_327957 [Meredithblackwellia eburnea MCA 4105]
MSVSVLSTFLPMSSQFLLLFPVVCDPVLRSLLCPSITSCPSSKTFRFTTHPSPAP